MANLLEKREILPLLPENQSWEERRRELMTLLCEYEYGYTPAAPAYVQGEIFYEDKAAYAGKVLEQHIRVTFPTPKGPYTFPFKLFLPYGDHPLPTIVNLAFRPDTPDRYVPVEELCDRGYGLAVVCYQDITPDSLHGDFTSGLAAMYVGERSREPAEWGKIGMWAYGASRVIDYLLTRGEIDAGEISVAGHSRLGKTALWCAAQDPRVYCAISNNSGYGGAALSKNGTGEYIELFLRAGSYDWFCPRFCDYNQRDNEKPYDQHMLLALIAPRYICVGSASQDAAADPASELLSCYGASEAYLAYGLRGLVGGDALPEVGTALHAGEIGYHLRAGRHFFSREDWNRYCDFLDGKRK